MITPTLRVLALLAFIDVFPTPALMAQDEEPAGKAAILLQRMEIKSQSPSGSSAVWTKVICQYETTRKWTDGVTFLYEVLLTPEGEGKQKPIIAQGSVGFANVPMGKNLAIIYLSPGATARYGKPSQMRVTAVSGDDTVGTLSWPDTKDSGGKKSPEDDWTNQYNRRDGILLPLRFTPFLLTDYDLMPDPLAQ